LNPDLTLPGWTPKAEPDLVSRMMVSAAELSRTSPQAALLLLDGAEKLLEMEQRLEQADEIIGRFCEVYAGR
jgi:hypothetical protein